MWLIAPRIPTHVRETLDDFGIEYEEIYVAKFKQVAEDHGILTSEERSSTESIRGPVDNTVATQVRTAVDNLSIPDAVDQAGKHLKELYGDKPIPRKAIVSEVQKMGSWPAHSIIPSDFCYNRENEDSRPSKYRVFLWEEGGRGNYKYVGRSYPYSGPIFREPKNLKKTSH